MSPTYSTTKTFFHERQNDIMDCGPTCLKMIADHFEIKYPKDFFNEICNLRSNGISFYDLGSAAETIGLTNFCVWTTINFLYRKVSYPCIIHLDGNHFVVVYKVTSISIYIADPAKGLLNLTHRDLRSRWYNKNKKKGAALILQPKRQEHSSNHK